MKEQKCAKCGSEKNLTKDHIIPRWLYKRINNFDVNIKIDMRFKKNLGQNNIQILCAYCNSKKGGGLDMEHQITQQIFPWIEELYDQMNRSRLRKRISFTPSNEKE